MAETIADLQRRMDAAAQDMDFEEASRLRDRISLMRSGATREQAEQAETAGLVRQQPGAMGLGTSQQRVTPPSGWKPPPKPDPMTKGLGRDRSRKA
jgi:UvrB/uvrC motif